MKAYSYIFFIGTLLFLMGGECAFAQTKKPKWAETSYFEEGQNSYIEVVSATGWETNNAKEKALKAIVQRRSLAVGSDAKVTLSGDAIVVDGSKDLIVKSRVVSEYDEKLPNGEYKVYLLVQTAKRPDLALDPVSVTDKYPFSGRVFVPGMAQIHKGSVAKGACFIAGEVVFIGGIVVGECLRNSYVNKINSTHNADLRQKYIQNANICGLVRNISIAGAAAVYVWNVIDGIVAKGESHITLGNAALTFAPYADFESSGLAVNINF